MKRILAALLVTASALPLLAQDEPPSPKLSERAEKLISDSLPTCDAARTIKRSGLVHKLPANLTGAVVRVESDRKACEGQWVAITSLEGDFYFGIPWFIEGVEGNTTEEKLRAFTLKAMNEIWEPVVDRTQKSKEGLYKVTLYQTNETGKLPFTGYIDPAGTVVFLGNWYPMSGDVKVSRVKTLEPYIAASPAEGAAKPEVTVIEFSDFECPSCMRAAEFLKPIMEKHGDKVRYVRYDLPLMNMHPWAFSAAMAGRAIYKQKPDLFWTFKKQIYESQEKLSAFTIDDFARNFAKDHELNLEKYDADVQDAATKKALIEGAGAAFAADVRGTPTYIVNGVIVDAGDGGKALAAYVDELLKGSAPAAAATK